MADIKDPLGILSEESNQKDPLGILSEDVKKKEPTTSTGGGEFGNGSLPPGIAAPTTSKEEEVSPFAIEGARPKPKNNQGFDITAVKIQDNAPLVEEQERLKSTGNYFKNVLPAIENQRKIKTDLRGHVDAYEGVKTQISNIDHQLATTQDPAIVNDLAKQKEDLKKQSAFLSNKIVDLQEANKQSAKDVDSIGAQWGLGAVPKLHKDTSYSEGSLKSFNEGYIEIIDALEGAERFVTDLTGINFNPAGTQTQSEYLRKANASLKEMPEGYAGDVLKGVSQMVPALAVTAVFPETRLGTIAEATGGTITKVPGFTTQLAATKFFQKYGESGDTREAMKAGAEGALEGTVMHMLGYGGHKVAEVVQKVAKNEVLSGAAGATATGLLFGANDVVNDVANQYLNTGKVEGVDWNRALVSTGTGVAFGIPGLASAAYKRAVDNFNTAPTDVINGIIDSPKTAEELRNDALAKIEEAANLPHGPEKQKAQLAATALNNAADIKAIGDVVVEDPQAFIEEIRNDSNLTDEEKQFYEDRINQVATDNDPRVKASAPFLSDINNLQNKINEIEASGIDPNLKDIQKASLEEQIKGLKKKAVEAYNAEDARIKEQETAPKVEVKAEEVTAPGVEVKAEEIATPKAAAVEKQPSVKPEELKVNVAATGPRGFGDVSAEDASIKDIDEGAFMRLTNTSNDDAARVNGFNVRDGVLRVRVGGAKEYSGNRTGGATHVSLKVPEGFDPKLFAEKLAGISHEGGRTTETAVQKVVQDIKNAVSESSLMEKEIATPKAKEKPMPQPAAPEPAVGKTELEKDLEELRAELGIEPSGGAKPAAEAPAMEAVKPTKVEEIAPPKEELPKEKPLVEEALKDVESTTKALEEAGVKSISKIQEAPKSNKAVSETIKLLAKKAQDTLESVLFNWKDVQLVSDGTDYKFKRYIGRDRQFSKGKEGGAVSISKKGFLEWLMSNEPFNEKEYDQDKEWVSQINELRQALGYYGDDAKRISESYHADKAAGKQTELTKAVEDLLGKPTKEAAPPKETAPAVSEKIVTEEELKNFYDAKDARGNYILKGKKLGYTQSRFGGGTEKYQPIEFAYRTDAGDVEYKKFPGNRKPSLSEIKKEIKTLLDENKNITNIDLVIDVAKRAEEGAMKSPETTLRVYERKSSEVETAPAKPEAAKPEPVVEPTPTEPKEGDMVEIPSAFSGGMPRQMVYKDGTWVQKIGRDYTEVGKSVKDEAQAKFDEKTKPTVEEGLKAIDNAKESTKKFLKDNKIISDGKTKKMGFVDPEKVIDKAFDLAKVAYKASFNVNEAIKKAVEHIKSSTWYKSLTSEEKAMAEEAVAKQITDFSKTTKRELEPEQESKLKVFVDRKIAEGKDLPYVRRMLEEFGLGEEKVDEIMGGAKVEERARLKSIKDTKETLEEQYKKENPHSGGSLSGNSKAFDELPENSEIYVYTATTPENAKAILEGNKKYVPQLQGQGIKGKTNAIYVASDPRVVSGLGKTIIGFKVKKSDLDLSPEAKKANQTLGQSIITSGTGAILKGDPSLKFIAETQERINTSAKSGSEALFEVYKKVKTDGSNPELVKAVEDLLGKPEKVEPQEITPQKETIDKFSELTNFDKELESASTPAKRKQIEDRRQQWLNDNPSIKEIDANAKEIIKQLEDQGLITKKEGPCF